MGLGWKNYLTDIVNWIDIILNPCVYAFIALRLSYSGLKINPLDMTRNLEDEDPS